MSENVPVPGQGSRRGGELAAHLLSDPGLPRKFSQTAIRLLCLLFPDNPSHFVTVKFDDGVCHIDFLEAMVVYQFEQPEGMREVTENDWNKTVVD